MTSVKFGKPVIRMHWQVLNLAINFLQNRQFAKLKTSPKFPTIWYVQPSLSPSLTLSPSLQYGRGGFGEGEGKEVEGLRGAGGQGTRHSEEHLSSKIRKVFLAKKESITNH